MAVIISRRSSYCPNFATTPIRVGAIRGYKVAHYLHPNLYIQRIALDWR